MSPDVAKWCSEEKAEGLLSGTLMTYPNKHCSWTDLETLEVTGTESDPESRQSCCPHIFKRG